MGADEGKDLVIDLQDKWEVNDGDCLTSHWETYLFKIVAVKKRQLVMALQK